MRTSARVLKSDLAAYLSLGTGTASIAVPHKRSPWRYFNDELGPAMLRKGLPEDPMVFTMALE